MKTNSARWFQRQEDYQPRQTPKDSPPVRAVGPLGPGPWSDIAQKRAS